MAEHDPRVTAWANGFGVWHVRVPRHAVAPLLAARRALRDELEARENPAKLNRDVWLHPVRVEELDDAATIVYKEASPDEDAATIEAGEATTDQYIDDVIGLVEGFRYELCESCGMDLDAHTISPDPLGKPHAWCLADRES
jgi:hypothetical protein